MDLRLRSTEDGFDINKISFGIPCGIIFAIQHGRGVYFIGKCRVGGMSM